MFRINFNTDPPTLDEIPPPDGINHDPEVLRNMRSCDAVRDDVIGYEWWPRKYEPQEEINRETHELGDTIITDFNRDEKMVYCIREVVPRPTDIVVSELNAYKVDRIAKIESAIVAVYQRPLILSREYEQREREAQAYKDSDYTATVDPEGLLNGFAIESDIPLQQAAERVLQQASAFRSAEPKLGNLRMKKFAIERAADKAQVDAIYSDAMAKLAEIVKTL